MAKGIRYHKVGDRLETYLLIKTATKGIASNGKPFFNIDFRRSHWRD